MGAPLLCHHCDYDLREHVDAAICPECAAPVEESKRFAAIPIRPAWRDSDPRWRRRMLAGAWILVFVPLVAVLQQTGLDAHVPVVFADFHGFTTSTLQMSFVTWIYPYLIFCIGVVLLFAKERGRRPHRLDWTRRWGVFASYCVLVLGAALHLTLIGLVATGIAALFHGLPTDNQPVVTELLAQLGVGYLYYGPQGFNIGVDNAAAGFSAAAILLACVPMFEALRRTGSWVLALALLAPLALTSLLYLLGVTLALVATPQDRLVPLYFFQPEVLVACLAEPQLLYASIDRRLAFAQEAAKWLPIVGVAIWLSIAQARSWRRPRAS